jgi:hypothetical protein
MSHTVEAAVPSGNEMNPAARDGGLYTGICRRGWRPLQYLFHDFERGPLAMARCRAVQQGAKRVNRLSVSPNYAPDVALPELQSEHRRLAVGNLSQHHFIRKFDQLPNHKLEKFSHGEKVNHE